MIRIRKSKTTRKKLTGPNEGKPVAENVTQITSESRDQLKGQSRDQFKTQPREQVKNQPREQSRDQHKIQPRDHFRGHPRDQFKGQSRDQSKDQFRGDQGKKRRFPYQKKGSRERPDASEPRAPYEAETPEEELEKGGFVLPGELVGTTEEFKSGEGTTVSAGDIYSTATGNVIIDRKARVVSVRPRTLTPNILKVGDIIYGKITDVRESGAMVEVAGIEGKEDREIVNVRSGDIHVSNVRDSYVKRLSDEFRPSDIIRARVLDTERMRLTTAEDSLGVVKAYCSNCKGELVLEGKKLKCPVCNMTETRKISTEYGKGVK
ncbi:exosome complex RNA-binding protein Csl4 [Methanosarcina barkeri 3]|uniref:Exosome complex component Csl4 n=1 Tax=Methanosarcina barkeri 3 TaxID=1434107 RepID=A0A0E3WW77_METBA|nr:exosome complex RNA-binding protein Csl4 [Methanosarcina barkeri]AKB82500.1 exosome complex RNA-binding protein Csl4 [Methanosarcina barkeri 3]